MTFVIAIGYITPDGARSASYCSCEDDDVVDRLDAGVKYCEKNFPIYVIKAVTLEEGVDKRTYDKLREEAMEALLEEAKHGAARNNGLYDLSNLWPQ